MSTLYMKASPGQISKYVIFSGDPWRVNVFENLMTDVEKVAFAREYNTLTGTYQGVRITATSTGIGAPQPQSRWKKCTSAAWRWAFAWAQ